MWNITRMVFKLCVTRMARHRRNIKRSATASIVCSHARQRKPLIYNQPYYWLVVETQYLLGFLVTTSELDSTLFTTYILTTDLIKRRATRRASCLRFGTAIFCISLMRVVSRVSNIYNGECSIDAVGGVGDWQQEGNELYTSIPDQYQPQWQTTGCRGLSFKYVLHNMLKIR